MTRNLLLVTVGGVRCGIWEDDVASVVEARPVHRLPMSPHCIAGIAMIEDRGAMVLDLGACLGAQALAAVSDGKFLLVGGQEKTVAFAVGGSIETLPVDENTILPFPRNISTPVMDRCAFAGDIPVPLINIRELHERIRRGSVDPPVPVLAPRDAKAAPEPGTAIRLFSLDGQPFCVPAAGTSYLPLSENGVIFPPHLESLGIGIIRHEGRLAAVMTLTDRLGTRTSSRARGILLTETGDDSYGLLVDEDLGTIPGNIRIHRLPPIARTVTLSHACVADGRIYPMIDRKGIDAPASGGESAKDIAYSVSGEFAGQFEKTDVEIVEFSLLGSTYAVPRTEVAEIVPTVMPRFIPGAPIIVLGVAEQGGDILPVLDPAAVFRKRSRLADQTRMLRMRNGDFEALVAVEKVLGEKSIPPESQRQVPLTLPHPVLYGCYLDSGAVRLILNMEALAVHCEKSGLLELVEKLAPSEAAAPVVEAAAERIAPEPVPAQEEPEAVLPAAPLPAERTVSEDEIPVAAAPVAAEAAEEAAAAAVSEKPAEEILRVAEPQEEPVPPAAEISATGTPATAESAAPGSEAVPVEQSAEREQPQQALTIETAPEESPLPKETESTPVVSATQEPTVQPQQHSIVPEVTVSGATLSGIGVERPKRSAADSVRYVIAVAAILLVAVVGFYVYNRPVPQRHAEKGQHTVATTVPRRGEGKRLTPEDAPLVMKVPAAMPLPKQDVYVVRKGDTLWSIAKRFTGNPMNYPRLAKDNSIATPDLIFPGQKIRLVREEKPVK